MLDTLQQYGFSPKEAKVYLASLQLGSAPGSTIARHAGEKRVTVYSLLKELQKRGIVQAIPRNGVTYFSVLEPDVLLKQLEDKYQAFKERMPELMAVAEKIGNKPKVQFFEGVEGLKAMFDEFSATTIDMKVIITTERTAKEADLLLRTSAPYRALRKEKGLIAKRIIDAGAATDPKKEKEFDKAYGRKTVIIKDFPLTIKADINIFGPWKVSFLFFEHGVPYITIIHSQILYQTLDGLFEYIWHQNTKK